MSLEPETLKSLVRAAAEQVIASAPELTALDQAIGDGDHGANMKRGFEAVLGKLDSISAQPLDEAFKTIGKTLVMTVGGAAGPLYGSFFLAVGDALRSKRLPDDLADIFGSGVGAVSARGRSQAGEKTMLDVLFPVLETLKAEAAHLDLIKRVRATASEAVARTVPMQATKGRASFLGARSVGHIDPGARSSCVLLHAVCDTLQAQQ
jgi:dihydroxyacetone kinase-like protein